MEELTSRKNKYIQHLRALGSERTHRLETGEFLSDGKKLLREALQAGAQVTSVLWKETAEKIELPPDCVQYTAPAELFDYASPMKNSPGPLFTLRIPPMRRGSIRNAIVLETVQDPGNVGTVIRTANAFGIDAVILTGACADLYHAKTVRATMGAIFRQRVIELSLSELPALLRENGLKLYGAALSDRAADLRERELCGAAVAVGSEGQGLSRELLALCDEEVIIPMQPESESLNAGVAASVLMWEMARGGL